MSAPLPPEVTQEDIDRAEDAWRRAVLAQDRNLLSAERAPDRDYVGEERPQ